MNAYANLSAESSVRAYEVGKDYILVRFKDGSLYLYTYASAGKANIERAKKLAYAGIGLGSWIMRVMKRLYASKGAYGF